MSIGHATYAKVLPEGLLDALRGGAPGGAKAQAVCSLRLNCYKKPPGLAYPAE